MTISPTVDGPPIRVFVGLSIGLDVASQLARFAQALDDPAVRPVAASDIHLTLVPPWSEVDTSGSIEKLNAVAARFAPFLLSIHHVGYGPDPRRPRLLWADCAAGKEIGALRGALLEVYGQSEDRPFRPHVTLARIRRNGRAIARKHPIDQDLNLAQPVDAIALLRSPLAGERNYRILATAALSALRET